MPLDIAINPRSNALEVSDGRTVILEFQYDVNEIVVFKYSNKTFETLTCLSAVGSLAPTTIKGINGKLEHPTSPTVDGYNLTLSGTVKAGAQPSNVTFTLKKKSTGSGLKNPNKPLPTE